MTTTRSGAAEPLPTTELSAVTRERSTMQRGGTGGRRRRRRARPLGLRRIPYTNALALLIALGTPTAAWLNSRGQTPVYGARTEVIANGVSDAPNAAQFEAAVGTERVVLASRAVLEPVAVRHALSVADLEDALEVDAVTGSTVLELTYENEDPQLALDVARSLIDTYLALAPGATTEAASTLLETERLELVAERAEVEDELVRIEIANAEAEAFPDGSAPPANIARRRRLAAESEDLLRRIGDVEERLSELAIESLQVEGNSIVSPPFVLPDPVRPDPVQAAALGLFVGVALGGSMVLVRAQLAAARRETDAIAAEREI